MILYIIDLKSSIISRIFFFKIADITQHVTDIIWYTDIVKHTAGIVWYNNEISLHTADITKYTADITQYATNITQLI